MASFPFTTASSELVTKSREVCEGASNTQMTPIHLGLALCDETASDKFFVRLLSKTCTGDEYAKLRSLLQAKLKTLPKQDPPPDSVSPDSALLRLLKNADALRKKNSDSHIAVDHIVAACLTDAQLTKLFSEAGINTAALSDAITQARGSKKVTSENAEKTFDALSKYGEDLVARAESGKIDPVIGRDEEIRRVIRVLSRRT